MAIGRCTFVRVALVAALAGLGACAATPPPPPPEELPPTAADAPPLPHRVADGRWELVQSSLAPEVPLPGSPRPTLEFKDGRLAAYSGCNRATVDVVQAGGRLAVGRLAATRMACPEPLASFERRYFALIEAEPALRFEDDQLLLVAGKDSARFQRAGGAPEGKP